MKAVEIVPELMVENMRESLNFYQRLLGFQLTQAAPNASDPVWALLTNGPCKLMLYHRQPFVDEIPSLADQPLGGSFAIHLKVKQINKLYQAVRRQAKLIHPLHTTEYGQPEFVIRDNSGYLIICSQAN